MGFSLPPFLLLPRTRWPGRGKEPSGLLCSSHRGSAVGWAHLLASTSHPPALQVCQVLWGQEQGGFLLVLCPSPFLNHHVPKNQPVDSQTSPDPEHLPGKGTERTKFSNSPFLQGSPFILLALPSPPHGTLPWTISSPVSSPFPSVHWASSPCPVPPLAFCLSHSLAYSLQPLPLSGVMAWIVCLCQALHLLERGRKKRKKSLKPLEAARRQHSGKITLPLLSLHAAFLFVWRDYLGCPKETSLPGLQPFGRANLANLLLPGWACWGGRHRGIKPPSPCRDGRKMQLLSPFSCLPGVSTVAAKVAPYIN